MDLPVCYFDFMYNLSFAMLRDACTCTWYSVYATQQQRAANAKVM